MRLEVSGDSNPTLATLRNIIRGKKTNDLRDLYEWDEEVYRFLIFYLIAYDPIHFDEIIIDELWVKDMDEEIGSIERNNTWELVDFLKIRTI